MVSLSTLATRWESDAPALSSSRTSRSPLKCLLTTSYKELADRSPVSSVFHQWHESTPKRCNYKRISLWLLLSLRQSLAGRLLGYALDGSAPWHLKIRKERCQFGWKKDRWCFPMTVRWLWWVQAQVSPYSAQWFKKGLKMGKSWCWFLGAEANMTTFIIVTSGKRSRTKKGQIWRSLRPSLERIPRKAKSTCSIEYGHTENISQT